MKQVIGTVVSEIDLWPVDPHSERAEKSAIAFVPHQHARVIAARRAHRPSPLGRLAIVPVVSRAVPHRQAHCVSVISAEFFP
ncbi:MAG TPA: hypothetical protein VIJ39_12350 [Solirubrobacteraceae bacterium]